MEKINNSKRAIKGTITKIETFVEESGNHTPTKLDIKLKRVEEMNRKIDELMDQYYDIKDISVNRDYKSLKLTYKVWKTDWRSWSFVHNHENAISQANSKLKLEIKQTEIPLPEFRDRETRKQFEQSIDSNQIPELDRFIMFLEKRSQTIDSINHSAPITHKPKQVPFHKEHSLEEEICETQHQTTHYRTEEGRYVVQLPLTKDPYCLGNSRFLAEVRLNQSWKKTLETL
ncbi:hypothetical protein TNCV_1937901 [Trichonephila clavipes]|nr:hypothetical protein TNCV_1937901 [Trichonephila clavipes]